MFNPDLETAVQDFTDLMLPLSERSSNGNGDGRITMRKESALPSS